jgi:hypothetical protein
MKTRIILKSFDALSFGVFLSKSSSDQTGDPGSSSPKTNPGLQPQSAADRADPNCGDHAFTVPEGGVWAGLVSMGRQPSAQ